MDGVDDNGRTRGDIAKREVTEDSGSSFDESLLEGWLVIFIKAQLNNLYALRCDKAARTI